MNVFTQAILIYLHNRVYHQLDKPLKIPHSPIPCFPSEFKIRNQVSLVFKTPLDVPLACLKFKMYFL